MFALIGAVGSLFGALTFGLLGLIQAAPSDAALDELAKMLLEAVTSGQGWFAAALVLLIGSVLAKRYLAKFFPKLDSPITTVIVITVGAFAGAVANALAAGAAMTGALALAAAKVAGGAFISGGGVALFMKFVWPWIRARLGIKDPVAEAEQAGEQAAQGVNTLDKAADELSKLGKQ